MPAEEALSVSGASATNDSQKIHQLTPIWQRILQRAPIRPEDNFFDLGGNSASAARLFAEIAQAFGRNLPDVTICQAPTIAALAALLEQDSVPAFPPIALLRAGTIQPPVFITHGIGGDILGLSEVARHIQAGHPILGMQSRGIDGGGAPFDRIEEMAEYFLNAIRPVQPHGPYLLVGYSLGGLVTLEMAHRLTGNGEKVALLALLDTYPHKRFLTRGQRARLNARLARNRLAGIILPPFGGTSSGNTRSTDWPLPSGAPEDSLRQQMREGAQLALINYRPCSYDGKIVFVKAKTNLYFPDNPVAVWGNFADKVHVEIASGDHAELLTTYSEQLASILDRYIDEASC
jgi:thioesterase domain-containing protein/acyl carrier protein